MIEPFENHLPRVGAGAYVHALASVIGDVEIGAESSVWPGASLRGDHGPIRIGARTSVQDGAVAHTTENLSRVVIGDECTVGHRAILHGCVVSDHVLVGMGSILLDECEIGEWTMIGAGALVPARRKIPSGVLVLGSPARVVRDLTEKERDWITYSWKAYVEYTARFLRAGAT